MRMMLIVMLAYGRERRYRVIECPCTVERIIMMTWVNMNLKARKSYLNNALTIQMV